MPYKLCQSRAIKNCVQTIHPQPKPKGMVKK